MDRDRTDWQPQSLRVGLSAEMSWEVTPERTAAAVGHDAEVAVFATALMGLLAELASTQAIAGCLAPGEQHVGTLLEIHHLAATPVGFTVKATSTLVEIDGPRLLFHVDVWDDAGKVGEIVHGRRIVDWQSFLARLAARRTAVG